MPTNRYFLLVTVLSVLLVFVIGCGGSSGPATGVGLDASGAGAAEAPPVGPASLGTTLTGGSSYSSYYVAAGDIYWYRLLADTSTKRWVVTLQPTAGEDSDLRILQMTSRKGTWTELRKSIRSHSTGYSDSVRGGYNPDWVAFQAGSGRETHVAVYGVTAGNNYYRIEADLVPDLVLNTPTAETYAYHYNSVWYRIHAYSGYHYTLSLAANSGDPDMYLYKATSTGYVGKSAVTGGGTLNFTSSTTADYYVRVYGYSSSRFTLVLTRVT